MQAATARPQSYVRTYENLMLCSLTKEQHDRTCGYWYVVTEGAGTPHTAFRNRATALRWLSRLGLSIDRPLNDEGDHGVYFIKGGYRKISYLSPASYSDTEGSPCLVLDNARFTIGKLSQDDDGLRTVHYVNCNYERPEIDFLTGRLAEEWDISPERAQEIERQAAQWPFWGNVSRFMTREEEEQIQALWVAASETNRNLSRASILNRIARGLDPISGEPLNNPVHD